MYIRDDYDTFLFFLKHLHHGYEVPFFKRSSYFRYFFNKIYDNLVFFLFIFRIEHFFTKSTYLKEDFLVKIEGSGNWPNTITIKKEKGELWVYKKVHSNKRFEKEKSFYEKYKNNESSFNLPKSFFYKNNLIKIEFLEAPSLQKLLKKGLCSNKKILNYFEKIISSLKNFYPNNEKSLIHGDFTSNNLHLSDKYYLIDYSDSFVYERGYDIYSLYLNMSQYISRGKLKEIINKEYKFAEIKGHKRIYLRRWRKRGISKFRYFEK